MSKGELGDQKDRRINARRQEEENEAFQNVVS